MLTTLLLCCLVLQTVRLNSTEASTLSNIKTLLSLAEEISERSDSPFMRSWRRKVSSKLMLPEVLFDCEVIKSEQKPNSVHKLRPSDIDVIGAFGDSISAGNGLGASNAVEVAIENRGESFSIGGDASLEEGVVTLTNVLRKFNPSIKGYSVCSSTRDHLKRAWLNVAEPGAVNDDMPVQSRMIIDRMKADERIDFFRDWKMVTLFVGGNDLCGSCRNPGRYNPERYGQQFRLAVDILFNELPRVFVNIIPMFDVTDAEEFSKNRLCDALQINYCSCARNETTKLELRNTQLAYYEQLKALTEDEKYTYREDFAVVLQPFLRDFEPPRDPETGDYLLDFLGPDCFHPSRLGHQSFAFWLWNSLLTRVGEKPVSFQVNVGPEPNILKCPTTESPYLFTNINSR